MSNEPEVLTTAQLADWLNIHWRTLHRLRERGEGPPAAKIGRIYRYRRADVEAWLREQASNQPAAYRQGHNESEPGGEPGSNSKLTDDGGHDARYP